MRHHEAVSVWAIVVAAGSGARFGGFKQLQPLGDRRVIDHAVGAAATVCDGVVVALPEGVDWDLGDVVTVSGGPTRSASVRAALAVVPGDAQIIVVHDAARPLAGPDLFTAVIAEVRAGADGAVPARPIADTIKRIVDRTVVATVPRDDLMTVQTPQAFGAETLRRAHRAEPEGTDDAAVVEAAGGRVVVVTGPADNLKITDPADLERAAELLGSRNR